MRRGQLVHALEERLLGGGILQREIRQKRVRIDFLHELRVVEEALDLTAEDHPAVRDGIVVERLDAEDVARAHQAAALFVPDDERVHAAQAVHEVVAPLLIAVHEHLGVRAAVEGVALRLEFRAQGLEVVDLAVEHDDDVAVLALHRLRARLGQIEDGKAAEAERHVAVKIRAAHVRAAVHDAVHHAREVVFAVVCHAGESDKSTHTVFTPFQIRWAFCRTCGWRVRPAPPSSRCTAGRASARA